MIVLIIYLIGFVIYASAFEVFAPAPTRDFDKIDRQFLKWISTTVWPISIVLLIMYAIHNGLIKVLRKYLIKEKEKDNEKANEDQNENIISNFMD